MENNKDVVKWEKGLFNLCVVPIINNKLYMRYEFGLIYALITFIFGIFLGSL